MDTMAPIQLDPRALKRALLDILPILKNAREFYNLRHAMLEFRRDHIRFTSTDRFVALTSTVLHATREDWTADTVLLVNYQDLEVLKNSNADTVTDLTDEGAAFTSGNYSIHLDHADDVDFPAVRPFLDHLEPITPHSVGTTPPSLPILGGFDVSLVKHVRGVEVVPAIMYRTDRLHSYLGALQTPDRRVHGVLMPRRARETEYMSLDRAAERAWDEAHTPAEETPNV